MGQGRHTLKSINDPVYSKNKFNVQLDTHKSYQSQRRFICVYLCVFVSYCIFVVSL